MKTVQITEQSGDHFTPKKIILEHLKLNFTLATSLNITSCYFHPRKEFTSAKTKLGERMRLPTRLNKIKPIEPVSYELVQIRPFVRCKKNTIHKNSQAFSIRPNKPSRLAFYVGLNNCIRKINAFQPS